jgi:uncharacterized protein YjbJ (UPF0337 family)
MGEIIDKVKGKLKQAEGELTNDPVRKAEGQLDELKGNIKGAFEDVKSDVKKALRRDEPADAAAPPVKP